jgi:hypothetical protein
MTDHPTPPSSDEELSASLDGELDPARTTELTARLEVDPALRARRAALASAADRVREPVAPLDAATVDELVANALAAPVVPLPARATRGPAPWLVAAAITLLVAVGLGLVWSGRDGGASDQASTGADASSSAGATVDESTAERTDPDASDGASTEALDTSGDTAEAPAESSEGAPTSTIPPMDAAIAPPVDLGTFATGDDLRAALADAFPVPGPELGSGTSPNATVAPSSEQVERCATQLQVTLELEDGPLQVGYAAVEDAPVLVYEFAADSFADGSPTTLVAAVGTEACEQVVFFER